MKHFAHPVIAREALRRSHLARRGGVPTPEAFEGPTPDSLTFARVCGTSGVALLHSCPLPRLLAPLQAIHALHIDGLPRFDPFLRIRPRLARNPDRRIPSDLMARLARGLPETGVTLHGDFHFGQLILDPGNRVWVVDLDDLSTGPPEADLGNLAAHLATKADTALVPLSRSLAHWRHRIIAEWGLPCNTMHLDRFIQIAALRRVLKLRERGGADLMPELLPLLSVA